MGVLHELIRKELGVDTYLKINPLTDTIKTSRTKILHNNPDRVAFLLINLGENDIYVAPDENVAVGNGILLKAAGGAFSAWYKEDFHLVGFDWWGIAENADVKIYMMEVIAR